MQRLLENGFGGLTRCIRVSPPIVVQSESL